MSVRETLELDVSPALQSLRQFGQFLEGIASGFGDDLQQSIERALQGLPVIKLDADATSVTDEINSAVGTADGEKEVDGDATAVEQSVTEAVAAADGEKEVDGDATAVESAITEAVGAADGVKEIDADASGVTEAIEQAVQDANTDLSLLPPPPGADGAGGWGGVATGLALARTNAQGLSTAATAATQNLGTLGSAGSRAMAALATPVVAVGAGVGAIGALAVTSVGQMRDLERGIAEVATLLGDIPDSEVQRLTDGVRELSGELGIAAMEIVPALYDAISAGVPADNVFDFLRTAGKASIAGVTTLGMSVNGLTNIVNAFGLQASDTEAVADSMFAAVQGGMTTFDQLSRSIFQIAPAAAASGVSFQEVNAALATLTSSSVPTRVAATQLRAALVGLQRPSEELDTIFQDLGFENAELAIQQEGLAFALGAVVDASGGSAGALQQLLGSVEAVAAANVIAGTNANKFAAEMDRQASATGATEQAFGRMSDTLDFDMRRIREAIDDVRYGIGEALLPAVRRAASVFSDFLDSVGPVLQQALGDLGDVLGELADSFDAAQVTIDFVERAFEDISGWLPDMGDGFEEAADGVSVFAAGLDMALGPLLRIAELANQLVGLFGGDEDSVEEAAESAADAIRNTGVAEAEASRITNEFWLSVERARNEVQELSRSFVDGYDALVEWADGAVSRIPNVVDAFSELNDESNADELSANLTEQIRLTDRWTADMARLFEEGYDDIAVLLSEIGPEQSALLLDQYAGREKELEGHLEEMARAHQRSVAKINEIALRGYLEMRGITGAQANAIVLTLGAELQLGVPTQEAIDAVVAAPATNELRVLAAFGKLGSDATGAVSGQVNSAQGATIAGNLIDGMTKEMYLRVESLRAAADTVATTVIETVNGLFGNRSPSKVMMQTGRDVVAGLVLGLDESAPQAEAAMSSLAGSMMGVSLSAGGPSVRDVSVTVPVTVSGGMSAEDGRAIGEAAGRAAGVELARMMRLEARVA